MAGEASRQNGAKGGRPRKQDGPAIALSTPAQVSETPKPTEVHPLLAVCTRKEQAFLLALLSDPSANQTSAYERAGFTARGASACANAARLLRKDRVATAYKALVTTATATKTDEAIASVSERRGILAGLMRDKDVHPLARIRAIDVDNKVEGVYIEKHEHKHIIPGAITFVVTQQPGAENRT